MRKTLILPSLFIFVLSINGTPSAQLKSQGTTAVTLRLGEGISLSMTIGTFDPGAHKITKCKILDWEGICLIDGKPVFGTDWELPKNQLICAVFRVGSESIDLDVSCMYNPWFGSPRAEGFSSSKVEGGYIVRGSFSDGAGSYCSRYLFMS